MANSEVGVLNVIKKSDETTELSETDFLLFCVCPTFFVCRTRKRTKNEKKKFPTLTKKFKFSSSVLTRNENVLLQLFYLITESYILGSLKEMQKWAYEIHSSFLVPGAALRVPNVEQSVVEEIDRGLAEDFDNESSMKKLFWKPRAVARKTVKEQLASLVEARQTGLGRLFGPSDADLAGCVENRTLELKTIDELVLPILDSIT